MAVLQINELGTSVDFNNFIPVLNEFQSDGIDYLYDLEPQSNNLFYAGFFQESTGPVEDLEIKEKFWNAAYRIQKVSVNLPKISTKTDPVTKVAMLDTVSIDASVNVSWIEDVYHTVKKYHLDWISRWYNREYDVLRCGAAGKFRQLYVIAFHYIDSSTDPNALISTPKTQPIFLIKLMGLAPENIGSFTFDHSSDGNESTIDTTYRASKIALLYSRDILAESWNPVGFEQENNYPALERERRRLIDHVNKKILA
jgi:hypothetical protein